MTTVRTTWRLKHQHREEKQWHAANEMMDSMKKSCILTYLVHQQAHRSPTIGCSHQSHILVHPRSFLCNRWRSIARRGRCGIWMGRPDQIQRCVLGDKVDVRTMALAIVFFCTGIIGLENSIIRVQKVLLLYIITRFIGWRWHDDIWMIVGWHDNSFNANPPFDVVTENLVPSGEKFASKIFQPGPSYW